MRRILSAYARLFRDRAFFRLVIPVAAPIALQNLVTSVGALGSSLFVGQLGEFAVAGVSAAIQAQFMLILASFGIGSGAAIFSSQFWGRRDKAGVVKTQGIALVLTAATGLAFSLIAGFFPEWAIGLFTPDPQVVRAGSSYLKIAAWSYPILAVGMSYSIILRSVGDTKTPLQMSLIGLSAQVVLSGLFVFGIQGDGWTIFPRMGVAGAALALVVARVLETCGLIILTQTRRRPNSGNWKELLSFDRRFLARYLKTALPVVVSEVLWAAGMSVVKAIYGWMGGPQLATYAVLETFSQLVFVVFMGTGNAAAMLLGQAIGRGDLEGAQILAGKVALFAPVVGLAAAVPVACLAPFLPHLYRLPADLQSQATVLIFLFAALLPGKAFYHDMIVGVLRSGADTNFSFAMDQLGVWLWAVPLGFVFAFVAQWPLPVVYFLINLEEPLKSLLALGRLRSGRWMKPVPST